MSSHDTGWDGAYHRYPKEPLPWELGRPREILIELLKKKQLRGRALDLCCGAGSNTVYMAQQGLNVTALDISDKALEYTMQKSAKALAQISLLQGDFLHLPLKDAQFDFVFDFGCFHHVLKSKRNSYIQNVHNVMKPKATYLLVCFSHHNGVAWNHFTKEQINRLFNNHFQIEWIRHVSSLEADNITRHFYQVIMEKLH